MSTSAIKNLFSSDIPSNIKQLWKFETTAMELINHYKSDLNNKIAIVTGGASGIGTCTSYALVGPC